MLQAGGDEPVGGRLAPGEHLPHDQRNNAEPEQDSDDGNYRRARSLATLGE
jgi:hypothetical protein